VIVTTTVRDLDGARSVQVDVQGSLVFMWGRGFSYVFDKGIVLNALRKEFSVEPIPQEPQPDMLMA